MPFKYQPQWQGPLSGRSFEKQTEDFLNGIESRVDEIDTRQTPSDATPMPPSVGDAGASLEYSRGDHSHPLQTSVSGNAGTATKLETSRDIVLSGDASGTGVFDGTADCSISVSIQDATPSSAGFMSATDKAVLDALPGSVTAVSSRVSALEDAAQSGPFVAQSQNIHVDATNGDDGNDGKTASTAVKTLERAFKLWNSTGGPQPNLCLHGNHVYETPAVVADAAEGKDEGQLIYTGGAPHIIGIEDSPGDGFPTLKFIFCVSGTTPETVDRTSRHYTYGLNTMTTGPRFYTSHPHFSDIAIDSNVNGVYFEGCSVTFERVDFKIPCRIISSAGDVGDCSFFAEVIESGGQSYNPFGASACSALYFYHSNCFVKNPTFNVEDGKTHCCQALLKSSIRVDGTITVKNQTTSSGLNFIFSIDSSAMIMFADTISGGTANWTRGVGSSGCSELFFSNDTIYNTWNAVGSGVVDSGNALVHVGSSIIPSGANAARSGKTNSSITIYNGSQASDGGGIWLYGKNHPSSPGRCTLQASDGSSFYGFFVEIGKVRMQSTFTEFLCDTTATLGDASKRWGQLFTTTAPNTSSDERRKQQIAEVPDEVLDAWEEVKWRQYKLNDSVESKGEGSRLHTGLIAQNIDAAFKGRGLDASRYGLFCHDAWTAQPEETSEEGTAISPAMPAGDEFSLRYEEALSMEAAYMRRMMQRLEARISKLEKDKG